MRREAAATPTAVVAGNTLPAPVVPTKRAWAAVGTLSITETVAWGVLYYAFGAIMVPMEHGLGLSRSALTLAFSCGLVVCALVAPSVGRHVDRHGARGLMTAGAIVGTVGLLLWSGADSYASVLVAFALIGLAQATTLYDPAFVAIAQWFGNSTRRSTAALAMTTCAGLASFIFVPLSSMLAAKIGWQASVQCLAVVFGVCVILGNASLPIAQAPTSTSSTPISERLAIPSGFTKLRLAFALQAFVSTALSVHLFAALMENGFAMHIASFAVGLVGVAQIPGRWVLGAARGRFPSVPYVRTLLLSQAIATALIGVAGGSVATIAALVIYGASNGMLTLARADVVIETWGVSRYGELLMRMSSWGAIGKAVAPFAVAVSRDAAGDYLVVFLSAGALLSISSSLATTRSAHAGL